MAVAFQPIAARPAPVGTVGFVPWIRANLFANGMSAATTVVLILLAVYFTPGFVKWAYVDAVFRPTRTPARRRAAWARAGAWSRRSGA